MRLKDDTPMEQTKKPKMYINSKANLSTEGWREVIPDLEIE